MSPFAGCVASPGREPYPRGMLGRALHAAAFVSLVLSSAAACSGEQAYAQARGVVAGTIHADRAALQAGIVAFLESVPGDFEPSAQPAILDQRHLMFVPSVLAILRGTTVQFRNDDVVAHNVFSIDGERYDLGTWRPGLAKQRRFNHVGVYRQLCRIHPEMGATIVVLQNPYFAVVDRRGHFRITEVPPGDYTLVTWSAEGPQVRRSVRVTVGATTAVSLVFARSRP